MKLKVMNQAAEIVKVMLERSEQEARNMMGDEYDSEDVEWSLELEDWMAEIEEASEEFNWSPEAQEQAAKMLYELQK